MLVYIRGAGDIASGIAWRLHMAGMEVVMTDLPEPTSIRRAVCFSEAIRLGETTVEGIKAVAVKKDGTPAQLKAEVRRILAEDQIAVLADPEATSRKILQPEALVDAILAKKNLGTSLQDAPVVIGVGPGFTAGVDCHAAVETMRGHTLGRALYTGSPLPDTGIPGKIGGYTVERVLRAPAEGIFHPVKQIGDDIKAGETVGMVEPGSAVESSGRAGSPELSGSSVPMIAAIDGVLRGILPEGTHVTHGMKSGDIDPRDVGEHCYRISDKALAVGGGVLEAILHCKNKGVLYGTENGSPAGGRGDRSLFCGWAHG